MIQWPCRCVAQRWYREMTVIFSRKMSALLDQPITFKRINPRGGKVKKETALDVCGYAAHMAALMGANIIKVKPPSDELDLDAAKKGIGHLEERWQELVAAGTSADEATRLALAGFRDEHLFARNLAPLRQARAPEPITPGELFARDAP